MGKQSIWQDRQKRRAILADLGILCVALFWGGAICRRKICFDDHHAYECNGLSIFRRSDDYLLFA